MNRIQQFFQFLFAVTLLIAVTPSMVAQPDINEFVFVDSEPKALNLDSVRNQIGYPQEAISEDAEGTVVVRILVDTAGNYVRHSIVKIVHPALAVAVDEHVGELKFEPAMQGGKPIMFWTNIPFPFKLIQTEVLIQERIDMLSEELAADPENYELWHKRGIQYTQLGDYEKAEIDFNESLSLNPRKNKKKAKKNTYDYLFFAHYGRAVAYTALERREEALADYNEAIRIQGEMAIEDSSVNATLKDVYLERGYLLVEMERFREGIEDYRRTLSYVEDSAQTCGIWRLVVEAGLQSENYPILVEAYDVLISCDENAKEIYSYSRAYYRMKSGDYEQAILDFRTAMNNTENPSIRIAAQNYLALSQFEAGLPADAMTSVEAALKMNALNPLAYYVRSVIVSRMEGPEAGCPDLKRALIYGLAGEEMESAKELLSSVCGEEWEE